MYITKTSKLFGSVPSFSIDPHGSKQTRLRCMQNTIDIGKPSFADELIERIKNARIFIVHPHGNFLTLKYIRLWYDIALRCPSTIFIGRFNYRSTTPIEPKPTNFKAIYYTLPGEHITTQIYDKIVPTSITADKCIKDCNICSRCYTKPQPMEAKYSDF